MTKGRLGTNQKKIIDKYIKKPKQKPINNEKQKTKSLVLVMVKSQLVWVENELLL